MKISNLSKFGVWQMPLFKCLRHVDLKENFKSTGRRDLNIKYTNFDQLKCWEYHAYECKNDQDTLTGEQTDKYHWEEETVYYLYWSNDSHTKGKHRQLPLLG